MTNICQHQHMSAPELQVNVLLYLTYLSTSTHCGYFPFHYHIYLYTDYRCRYILALFTISPTCPQAIAADCFTMSPTCPQTIAADCFTISATCRQTIAADCFTVSPTCPQTIAGDRFTVSSTCPTNHRCSLFHNLRHLSVQNQSL